MDWQRRRHVVVVGCLVWMAASGCGSDASTGGHQISPSDWQVQRLFPTADKTGFQFDGCLYDSPMRFEGADGPEIVAMGAAGTIAGLDPQTGEKKWSFKLPAPDGRKVLAIAQPAWIDDHRIVVAYHTLPGDTQKIEPGARRLSQQVTVVDLAAHAVDEDFGTVELEANLDGNDGGEVPFRPGHSLARPDLVIGKLDGDQFGKVYVTSGNTRDIQPWHGWAFEVDLDVWKEQGAQAAVTSTLVTTPEPDANCGQEGTGGSRERSCGGGLWGPAGPLVVDKPGGYEMFLAPGNGQLDLTRHDYANTLMRVGPGLSFDPGCDPTACADFDPDQPSQACMESCDNLWIPRMTGQDSEPPDPWDGRCDGLSVFACYARLDYMGGSAPAYVEVGGYKTLNYPTKDGHLYLIDETHLGTQFDRLKLVDTCGADGDACRWSWAGMAVTQPLVAHDGDKPILMVPTFMPDKTHPAGVVAVTIEVGDDGPHYKRLWEFPNFDDPEAVQRFREHPSRMALSRLGDDGPQVAWIVEPGRGGKPGHLIGLDVTDGTRLFEVALSGHGWKYTVPLISDDTVYVSSCKADVGPGHVEAFRLTPQSPK